MAILKQPFLDKIKNKHKPLIDKALDEIENISDRVEKIRINEGGNSKLGMGFQQNEFAYLIDVPSQNYYRMRKSKKNGGMDIALHHLVKISIFSGQTLDQIVFGESIETPKEKKSDIHEVLAEERLHMINSLQKTISLLEMQTQYIEKENMKLKAKLEVCEGKN